MNYNNHPLIVKCSIEINESVLKRLYYQKAY
jgi:hypothetical protein